ncbi:DUF1761 domain-containing protein [Mesorhizobium sp. Z1-4]|uniref:DUF1761 domain-containing protein n=1 Tax=Mesorhizobium sp. Z1-4 TaxID=2448478 RepID=UPI000FDA501C|nr:DUF1761 domain-containing protein [Mesorhizobium sp. Z1-4]
MDFGGLNYLAILVAAIAGYLFGAAYYGTLGKPWMKAARIDPADAKMSPALMITGFVAELVMAWVLAGVIGHLGTGQATLWNGVVSGAFIWLGFMATTVAVNQRYQGFGWDLTIIDAGHWLGVAIIMGGIIGWWGV